MPTPIIEGVTHIAVMLRRGRQLLYMGKSVCDAAEFMEKGTATGYGATEPAAFAAVHGVIDKYEKSQQARRSQANGN